MNVLIQDRLETQSQTSVIHVLIIVINVFGTIRKLKLYARIVGTRMTNQLIIRAITTLFKQARLVYRHVPIKWILHSDTYRSQTILINILVSMNVLQDMVQITMMIISVKYVPVLVKIQIDV